MNSPSRVGSLDELVPTVAALRSRLDDTGYLADDGLATALFCAARLPQPLLLEGEAGVGKTSAAKALAVTLDTPLVRLQCYEGIDASEALYEWNYPRQLLGIRVAEAAGRPVEETDLFGPEYLVDRPLLQALRHPGPRPAVLLIDEVDRADDEFEAFLFELLAESSVTIPELGTLFAEHPPVVVLTSNRTRDLHDAEAAVPLPLDRLPLARAGHRHCPPPRPFGAELATQVAAAVQRLRSLDIQKPPGVAEAIAWTSALRLLGVEQLDGESAGATLGAALKYRDDADTARRRGLAWVASGA